jgi:hypothetical protein
MRSSELLSFFNLMQSYYLNKYCDFRQQWIVVVGYGNRFSGIQFFLWPKLFLMPGIEKMLLL